jgi:signal transduction histidine kinase
MLRILDALKKGQEIILEIINFGNGISATEVEKLFEKFYRAKGNEVVGCGLGLAIVRKIIELHGGRVKFTSAMGRNAVVISLNPPTNC